MDKYEILFRLSRIMDKLNDDESRIIFEARIKYLFTRNENDYYELIENIRKESYCSELEEFLKDNEDNQGIIIFGAGIEGIRTKKLLDSCNRPAKLFCDNSVVGKIEGLDVIKEEQLIKDYRNWVVILSTRSVLVDIYSQLLRSGFPRKRILFPMYYHLVASNGIQYFDVLPPVENEVFVDAGSYNGDTIKEFIKWTTGLYKRIYSFEANNEMFDVINKYIESENVKNIIFTPKATWSKKDKLNFVKDSSASRIGIEGGVSVEAIDIDSVVGDDKVTYIKMDVEGSELQSLKGAQNIIRKYKPRLAISVYHRPDDIIEIAEYILTLNPDYKLLLRQYNSNFWETILYAF